MLNSEYEFYMVVFSLHEPMYHTVKDFFQSRKMVFIIVLCSYRNEKDHRRIA